MREEFYSTESTSRRLNPSYSAHNFYKGIRNQNFLDNKYFYNNKSLERNNSMNSKYSYHNMKLTKDYGIIEIPCHCCCQNREIISKSYENFFYKEGDEYETLINKNKSLKRLFEQVNAQLSAALERQKQIEKKYESEKIEIISKLNKIQKNYKTYANSHLQLTNFENKLDEISYAYNHLLEIYFQCNEKLREYTNKVNEFSKQINNFIENNYGSESINVLSFEFLLHLKKDIKELMKKNISKNKFSYKDIVNQKNDRNKSVKYFDNKYYNNIYWKNSSKENFYFYSSSTNNNNKIL